MAWVSEPEEEKSPLTSALISIHRGRAVKDPEIKAAADQRSQTVEETRKLFFLLRHLFVRDPAAVVWKEVDLIKISAADGKIVEDRDREDQETRAIQQQGGCACQRRVQEGAC